MKPVILITIALGCGLVAAIGVYQQMNKAAATPEIEKAQVVVAKTEVSINEAISEENVEIAEWAADQVPENAVTTLEELDGKYAKNRLYPGLAVLNDMVMDETEASSSILVPQGYRVFSIRVAIDSSVSNLIVPGDRVDVIVALRSTGLGSSGLAKIILSGVRVFAVNSDVAPSMDTGGSPDETRAVSLILQPDQVERLAMAAEMGTITLSLRSPDDAGVEETPGSTLEQALGRVDVADETSDGELVLNRGLFDGTDNAEKEPSGPYWSMQVLSPGNAVQYNWEAAGTIPQREVLYESDTSSSDGDSTEDTGEGDRAEDMTLEDLDGDIGVSDYSDGIIE